MAQGERTELVDLTSTLPLFTAGLFSGVAILSFLPLGFPFVILCALLGVVVLFVFPGRAALFIFVFLLSFSLGTARMGLADARMPRASDLSGFFDRHAVLVGTIVSDPERNGATRRARVDVQTLNGADIEPVRVLVLFDAAQQVAYGDRVALSGTLARPRSFETENGRLFDYESYLRKDGVIAILRDPSVELVELAPLSLRSLLFSWKHVFIAQSDKVFPEPQNGLLKGILLGERDALPPDLKEVFIKAGLIHIVVLSGYNVSLVADTLMKLFSLIPRLPRAGSLIAGSVAIVLFVVMVGAPATAVRAGTMALLIVLARALKRPRVLLRGLLLAGLLMVLWNPFVLAFDPSFQLSFLATLGLALFSSPIETRLTFLPARFGVRGIAAATLATQFIVLPALLHMSGVVSLVALPANLLALVAVPFSMLFGFLGTLFSPLPFLSFVPATLATLFLSYVLAVAKFATALPGSSFLIREFPLWLVFLLYGLIACGVLTVHAKRKRARRGESGRVLIPEH